MLRSPEHLMHASKANLRASRNLATTSIEDAAELVRHQLRVVMEMAEEETATSTSASGDAAVRVRDPAQRNGRRERQLQRILELSCQCLEVTAKAQTELVRLIQDNFHNMNEAMKIDPDALAGAHRIPKALRRA